MSHDGLAASAYMLVAAIHCNSCFIISISVIEVMEGTYAVPLYYSIIVQRHKEVWICHENRIEIKF